MRRQISLGLQTREFFHGSKPPLVDGDTVIVTAAAYAISADAIGRQPAPDGGLVKCVDAVPLLGQQQLN